MRAGTSGNRLEGSDALMFYCFQRAFCTEYDRTDRTKIRTLSAIMFLSSNPLCSVLPTVQITARYPL
eukprot:scaffold40035_cov56-Attheya_sp.AAC.5